MNSVIEFPSSDSASATPREALTTRVSTESIREEALRLKRRTRLSKVLEILPGPRALLNEHHQIVLANRSFARLLSLSDDEHIRGLRIGEILFCDNSSKSRTGCGTDVYCESCPLLAVIGTALAGDESEDRWNVRMLEGDLHTTRRFAVTAKPTSGCNKKYAVVHLTELSD